MTSEELSKILEQFAVCVIHTTMTDMEPDDQYNLISSGIDKIVETVMFVNDRNRLAIPSAN
jgi:hypothetical protein